MKDNGMTVTKRNNRLVCIENTHNRSGGRVFPLAAIQGLARLARASGLALHLDGARIFNAEVATGVPASVWAEPFDSIAFCLSKGLGAPVGSLIVGSRAFIARAHRFRKMFGGGMRQAGMLAAAGIFALEHHVERLALDHSHAALLAEGLERIPGVDLVREPETNMVLFRVADATGFSARARESGLLINPIASDTLRAVTHLDISRDDIDQAIRLSAQALG